MVAKLVLDQLEKTGGALTALTLPVANATASQYLQNNGSGVLNWSTITAASTNVQRAISNVTIGTTAGYDIDGTTEIVVACNAAAANRTITLPAVGAAGAATCIITVIADADATSTFKLVVEDAGSTEVWTGYQKNDFVRLIVSNSAWLVVDHKETMFSSRTLTADLSIAASATTKPTGYTSVTDIGGVWDNANNKLVSPFAGFWDLNWRLAVSHGGAESMLIPVLYTGGAMIYSPSQGTSATGYNRGMNQATLRIKVAASTDIEFYSHNAASAAAWSLGGNASNETGFDGTFTRTY